MILEDKYKRIIIEVGANNGNDTARYAADPENFVIAFEPHPGLFKELQNRFAISAYEPPKNLLIINKAISDFNGEAEFNLSELGDKGTSSLFDYHDSLLETPLNQFEWYAKGFAGKTKVGVWRLDGFLQRMLITRVDYLHIDAQGSDFAVLRGLGSYLENSVRAGRCEATYGITLYKNASNKWEDIKQYLEERNFEVKQSYIHQYESEVDLEFVRR